MERTVHSIHRESGKEHAVIMGSRKPHCGFESGDIVGVAEGETRKLIEFGL